MTNPDTSEQITLKHQASKTIQHYIQVACEMRGRTERDEFIKNEKRKQWMVLRKMGKDKIYKLNEIYCYLFKNKVTIHLVICSDKQPL